jgi:hypothetical protein
MGYILNEPKTFINIKLTDVGRRQLSLGNLRFVNAVFSDREIDYSIDRTQNYNIGNNRILSPIEANPSISDNFDGTNPLPLAGNQVVSAKQIATGDTESYGFFTGTTISTATTAYDITKVLGINSITYSSSPIDGGSVITLDNGIGSYYPNEGDLVYIPWEPIQNSGKTYSGDVLLSGNPTVGLWYRITTATSGLTGEVTLDRPIPNFNSEPTSQVINTYFYPYNAVDSYYGTATTVNPMLWNMNIVRTSSIEGTPLSVSGYTSYGSIEYNGTKRYLGFIDDVTTIGILHYTNEFTGNTYAEQLLEKTIRVDIPNIMWHNTSADNGQGLSYGVTLYDIFGTTQFDGASSSTYRELRDGTTSTSKVVGRVYHKLKIIVITDVELLTAMTYKSNRNYTLPPLQINSSSVPKFPLTTSQANGLLKSGKTYFVTYITESDSTYSSGSTFGYPKALHCGYIQKVNGDTDDQGNPQYLSATFPTNGFPYLRNSENMDSATPYSGTGWNANKVQLLVAEQTDLTGGVEFSLSNVPPYEWKLISNGIGSGIYTGDTTDLTIDPSKLNSYQFIVSQEDYDSGTTYVLDNIFTDNNDSTLTGLTFGNESFFFGNIKADILAVTYKTVITTFAQNDSLNSSLNTSFDSNLDNNTYISEIGVLDGEGNLVAVGKPTYPIKKDEGRFLTFQLQIDF